jgi:hypothetical protein
MCTLSFLLLVGAICHGTTAIFVLTPTGIVAGTDRLTKGTSSSREAVFRKDITKIQLINGKFIVASIGIERSNAYNFEEWITGVGSKLAADASVTQFVGLIEDEATKTFRDDMAIEKYMRSGALVKSQPFEDSLVEYIVAGYESGVPTIIRTYFNLDWHDKRLVGPVRDVDFPGSVGNPNVGIKMNGVDGGIGEFTNVNSYAYKRFHSSFPTIIAKFAGGSELTQEEAITLIRVLIGIQAEVTPSQVGRDTRIVVLPMRGAGSVTNYPEIPILPKHATAHKNKGE